MWFAQVLGTMLKVLQNHVIIEIEGVIFMPTITPRQKIEQVNMFEGNMLR